MMVLGRMKIHNATGARNNSAAINSRLLNWRRWSIRDMARKQLLKAAEQRPRALTALHDDIQGTRSDKAANPAKTHSFTDVTIADVNTPFECPIHTTLPLH